MTCYHVSKIKQFTAILLSDWRFAEFQVSKVGKIIYSNQLLRNSYSIVVLIFPCDCTVLICFWLHRMVNGLGGRVLWIFIFVCVRLNCSSVDCWVRTLFKHQWVLNYLASLLCFIILCKRRPNSLYFRTKSVHLFNKHGLVVPIVQLIPWSEIIVKKYSNL